MAVNIASSAKSGEHPASTVTPANEGQRAPGLVIQPVTLRAPHGMESIMQPVHAQEQGPGKVGRRAEHAPTHVWWGALLNRRIALFLVVVYLAATSVNNLAPVASRVICWASAWHKPVLSAVTIA